MNTRPLRIFLLGTTLAVGAVVGLAPAGEAKPPVAVAPGGPIVVAPPTTVKPPTGIEPCDLIDCDNPPVLVECVDTPSILCVPPTTAPPTTTPPTTAPPTTKPEPDPNPTRRSDNPDVVRTRPAFTG